MDLPQENGKPKRQRGSESGGDGLIQPPGPSRPEDQDAVGEGDVEELAQDFEGRDLREQEKKTQEDNPRRMSKEPPSDVRRKLREMKKPPFPPENRPPK